MPIAAKARIPLVEPLGHARLDNTTGVHAIVCVALRTEIVIRTAVMASMDSLEPPVPVLAGAITDATARVSAAIKMALVRTMDAKARMENVPLASIMAVLATPNVGTSVLGLATRTVVRELASQTAPKAHVRLGTITPAPAQVSVALIQEPVTRMGVLE